MKYVIHRRYYEYNDSYIEKNGKSVVSVKHFYSQAEVIKQWAKLERESGYIDDSNEDKRCIDLEVEPLVATQIQVDKYLYIIKTLLNHGIAVDEHYINLLKNNTFEKADTYSASSDLDVILLPDDVLIDLLLTCDISNYVVSKYEESNALYTLYFIDYEFSEYGGYLEYLLNRGGDFYVYENHPDLLFNEDNYFLDEIGRDEPLVTKLTDDDLHNSIVKSLLSQYPSAFFIFEALLYFAPCYKEMVFEERMSILRAMNEVLTYPFFEIRQFTPEEIITEFAKPSNDVRKAPPNVERFRKYVEGLDK